MVDRSEATRAADKRWNNSPEGRAAKARHAKTMKGRASLLKGKRRFNSSPKGQAAMKAHNTSPQQRARSAKYRVEKSKEARVHSLVNHAIRGGKLTRQPCQACIAFGYGEKKADAHHFDYDKPFEITWLCRRHHKLAHRGIDLVEKFGDVLAA